MSSVSSSSSSGQAVFEHVGHVHLQGIVVAVVLVGHVGQRGQVQSGQFFMHSVGHVWASASCPALYPAR